MQNEAKKNATKPKLKWKWKGGEQPMEVTSKAKVSGGSEGQIEGCKVP